MSDITLKYIESAPFEEGDFPEVNSAGEIIGLIRHRIMTLEEFKKTYPYMEVK